LILSFSELIANQFGQNVMNNSFRVPLRSSETNLDSIELRTEINLIDGLHIIDIRKLISINFMHVVY